MKDELTNIDIYVLCKELSGSHFSKIVRVPGGYKVKISGGRDLLIIPGKYIIPTSYVIEADRPDNLSIISRKRLGNARIESFEQLNFDRILRIRTDRGSIIIESFGDGNLIITDEDNIIIYALRERDWRDRSIRRGERYVPPPPPKIRPGISFEQFKSIFTAKDVVRSLVRAGLPPVYAEELCISAKLDKNASTPELGEDEINALYSAFSRLIEKLDNPEPVAVYDGDELVDITPVTLSHYKNYDIQGFSSFSDALDIITPKIFDISNQDHQRKDKRSIIEFWMQQLVVAKQDLAVLELMIERAYDRSYELETTINNARSGNPPESIGPFKLKRWDGREVIYEFTPLP